jgi:hypothetical protein
MDSSVKNRTKAPGHWLHLVQIPPILSISHTKGAVFPLRMACPLLPAVPVVGRTLRVSSPWILHPRLGQLSPGTGCIVYKSPPFLVFCNVFTLRMARPLLQAVPVLGRSLGGFSPWILQLRLVQNPPELASFGTNPPHFKHFTHKWGCI